jgi:hypothetical protein
MNRIWLQLGWLLLTLCGTNAQPASGNATARAPLPPLPASPVATFRMLLETNEAGRNQWLALNKPVQRQYLESKVAEYAALAPEERTARLQSLQLRWYLPQLMRMTPADRAARLAQITGPDRALLEGKLRTWTILPPTMRQDLLENQLAISVFVSAKQGGTNDAALTGLNAARRKELEEQSHQFDRLPEARRAQAIANYERFFGLPTQEQSQVLRKLTPAETAQMQQTLVSFNRLSPEERMQAMAGFRKFSELSLADRAAFLQTAERWQAMSETDRENWRKMVARLRSAGAIPPPLPPTMRKHTAALADKAK